MRAVGLITIGQSPRDDVVPELRRMLPHDVEIVQGGALDGLSPEDIAAHRPDGGEDTLVTRLTDGTEVTVDKRFVHQRIVELVGRLEGEVRLLGLLCSGSFPQLSSKVPFLAPSRLLQGVVPALATRNPIGVLVPSPEQVKPAVSELRTWGVEAIGRAVSPYTEAGNIGPVARELAQAGASVVLMHCFGYDLLMKGEVRRGFSGPVILMRSLFARVLAELLS